jgi:hypothetical protein
MVAIVEGDVVVVVVAVSVGDGDGNGRNDLRFSGWITQVGRIT